MIQKVTLWYQHLRLIVELRSQMKGLDKSKQAHIVGKAIAERAKGKGINSVVFR